MLKHRALQIVGVIVLAGLVIGGLRWLFAGAPSAHRETAALALDDLEALGAEFPAPVDDPPDWPRDHGAKPDQFAEYWLFAGLLTADDGRQYGFQLALYRLALQADEPRRDSAWAARDVYRAHLVIMAAGETLHAGERYSRAALGLSGTDSDPIRIWLENWQVEYDEEARVFHLGAADAGYGLDLQVALPVHESLVIEGVGHRGYWSPGLVAHGKLALGGQNVAVRGSAMLDRLWGRTLPVGRGQLALSRLWLELDDGSALRCRQLSRRAGGGTPLGECRLHRSDGSSEQFERDQISLEPLEEGWRNLGGVRYPLSWRLQLAGRGPALRITPLADDGAKSALPVWSGTVQVSGPATGWGLLELSNYAVPEFQRQGQ